MWVEVIGAIADIFHEAERLVLVGDEREATRHTERKCHGFFPQVADSVVVAELCLWEDRPVERCAERQRHIGNKVLAFYSAYFYAGMDDMQAFLHIIIYC